MAVNQYQVLVWRGQWVRLRKCCSLHTATITRFWLSACGCDNTLNVNVTLSVDQLKVNTVCVSWQWHHFFSCITEMSLSLKSTKRSRFSVHLCASKKGHFSGQKWQTFDGSRIQLWVFVAFHNVFHILGWLDKTRHSWCYLVFWAIAICNIFDYFLMFHRPNNSLFHRNNVRREITGVDFHKTKAI